MRRILAVMRIGGSLVVSTATAFAASTGDRESTDGTRFMAQRVTNAPVLAPDNLQPMASTITLPVGHNHDSKN